MTTHNTNSLGTALSVGLSLQHEIYDEAEVVLKARAMRALENGVARYPIHRRLQRATSRKLEKNGKALGSRR